jgi:hypothetical protein
MLEIAWLLFRLRGFKESRLVGNALLFKIPWARRFLMS